MAATVAMVGVCGGARRARWPCTAIAVAVVAMMRVMAR